MIAGHKPIQWKQVDIAFLLNNALVFHDKSAKIEKHRYRSWEHCYSFFARHQSAADDEIIGSMCLHLCNYLKSWGMFRGAVFQKDYKVHFEVVCLMLNMSFLRFTLILFPWPSTASIRNFQSTKDPEACGT
ncbi:hypothetical protein [Desulfitobacterium dichloroeliminans]|uniref:hypothetical protein n=1 Tax=Desulfitobacterium dichloroeliminans TaxID=233055 RepID=UPI000683F1B6|nr:hypothetical protein [Desulfitobacterium dichloroeliminans]